MVSEDAAKAQILADVGKFSALSVILCLSVVILPAFSFVTLALCPLPVLTVAARDGLKAGVAVALITGVVILPLAGVIEAIPLFMIIASLGLGYFVAAEKEFSFGKVVAAGTALVISALLVMGLLFFLVEKANIITQQTSMLKKFLLEMEREYVKQGISEAQVKANLKTIKESIRILPSVIPAAAMIFSIWVSLLSVLLSSIVLKKFKETGLARPAFKDWQLPWYFAWGYILGLAGTSFSGYLGSFSTIGRAAGINLLLVFNLLFMVQGFSIVYFYMDKFRMRSWMRAAGIGMFVAIPLASQVIAWFGLLDVWLNFRKLATEA